MRVTAKTVWSLLLLFLAAQAQSAAQAGRGSTEVTLTEAVNSTLQNHPLLRSQRAQVQVSIGLRQQSTGAFDTVLTSGLSTTHSTVPLSGSQQEQDAALGNSTAEQRSDQSIYGFGFQRHFRNGISISPQFQLDRTTDNLFNTGGLNTSSFNFLVNVPLLQGRGRSAVGAQEEAAKAEVDATNLDLKQLMAQLVLNAVTSYWNLVGAEKNLEIAKDAQDRAQLYLTQVQALVDADHVPRNDLHEVRANLYQKSSIRRSAEQQVLTAQEQLNLDMGIAQDQMLTHLPVPSDDFPVPSDKLVPSDSQQCVQKYLSEALHGRADYLAAGRRSAEAQILLGAARNKLQPRLDLSFSAGYAGLEEGRHLADFFSSSLARVRSPTATAGIVYNFAPSNHLAQGGWFQAQGTKTQSDVQQEQSARLVASQVVIALGAVRSSIERSWKAMEAVDSFRAALQGERDKYAGGIGSIVDILSVEDRLTSALLDNVQAELDYAQALAQFRFATGTLVRAWIAPPLSRDVLTSFPLSCSLEEGQR